MFRLGQRPILGAGQGQGACDAPRSLRRLASVDQDFVLTEALEGCELCSSPCDRPVHAPESMTPHVSADIRAGPA